MLTLAGCNRMVMDVTLTDRAGEPLVGTPVGVMVGNVMSTARHAKEYNSGKTDENGTVRLWLDPPSMPESLWFSIGKANAMWSGAVSVSELPLFDQPLGLFHMIPADDPNAPSVAKEGEPSPYQAAVTIWKP